MTVAEERVAALATLARETAKEDEALASAYVRLARRVAERTRVSLPKRFRRFTCKECDRYLQPGESARVRLADGHVVITCTCGNQSRYPYSN